MIQRTLLDSYVLTFNHPVAGILMGFFLFIWVICIIRSSLCTEYPWAQYFSIATLCSALGLFAIAWFQFRQPELFIKILGGLAGIIVLTSSPILGIYKICKKKTLKSISLLLSYLMAMSFAFLKIVAVTI